MLSMHLMKVNAGSRRFSQQLVKLRSQYAVPLVTVMPACDSSISTPLTRRRMTTINESSITKREEHREQYYYLAKEPKSPCIMTSSFPGPKTMQLKKEMMEIQECSTVMNFINYNKSHGNYIVDADDNVFLDCFGQISSIPIGYNHPNLINGMLNKKEEIISMLSCRPALGILPPKDWVQRLKTIINLCAPKGLPNLVTMLCGSSANENAYKQAMIIYENNRRKESNRKGHSKEELTSVMVNESPGSSRTTILSFDGSFHGRTFGALSTTRSKPIHKLDIAAFDWPVAPFPKLKYPLHENSSANEKEEEYCLNEVNNIMKEQQNIGRDVAAIVVEPVQAEGGDNHASPTFFRKLRKLCKQYGASFIVDEVQTGLGATGKLWAHEYWDLPVGEEPDFVTFSKKMQFGGYFHKQHVRPDVGYRIFNTWMGEPIKMIQLEIILNTIKDDNLLDNTNKTGKVLLNGLNTLQTKYGKILKNARGLGTFCAIDALEYNNNTSGEVRDFLINYMRAKGVWVGGCGEATIRLRPALIFNIKHCELFLDALEFACESVLSSK